MTEPSSQFEDIRLSVPEMDCPSCARKVEQSLVGLDGLREIDPQATTGVAKVTYDPTLTSRPKSATGSRRPATRSSSRAGL